MKLFENSGDLLDASSNCTDFHLDFLERIEADLQQNPVQGSAVLKK